MIAGLLWGQTERTLRTREVVHSSFSYVYVCIMRTNSSGPRLPRIASCTVMQQITEELSKLPFSIIHTATIDMISQKTHKDKAYVIKVMC